MPRSTLDPPTLCACRPTAPTDPDAEEVIAALRDASHKDERKYHKTARGDNERTVGILAKKKLSPDNIAADLNKKCCNDMCLM